MKTWTYKDITAATEKQITHCISTSIQHADSAGIAEMYKEWAYGAFNLWAEITWGERQDADFERLRKLANPDEHNSKEHWDAPNP